MRLQNKVALITGAASGIGRECALLFAADGADIAIGDLNDAGVAATVQDIQQKTGRRAIYIRADVSKPAEAENMVKKTMETFGRLNVLMNNAGIFPDEDGSVTDTPEDTWDLVIRVNLKGVFLGCKYGIPALLASG